MSEKKCDFCGSTKTKWWCKIPARPSSIYMCRECYMNDDSVQHTEQSGL